MLLNLIFLWSSTNLLIKRSENCDITRPKLLEPIYNFLHYINILLPFYIYWIQSQIIYMLLLISGIERNPGSKSSNVTISKTCACNGLGICGISHTCKVKGCNNEIFASCHCDSCEGYGPLLCYNHFINNFCRHVRTKSDLNSFHNQKQSVQTTQESNKANFLECSTCFTSTPISIVGQSPKCRRSLNKAKCYFHYTCIKCLTKSTNNSNELSTSETSIVESFLENEKHSIRIITHKRRKLARQYLAKNTSKLVVDSLLYKHQTLNSNFNSITGHQSGTPGLPVPLISLCLKLHLSIFSVNGGTF